jgi:hypothetical protein
MPHLADIGLYALISGLQLVGIYLGICTIGKWVGLKITIELGKKEAKKKRRKK